VEEWKAASGDAGGKNAVMLFTSRANSPKLRSSKKRPLMTGNRLLVQFELPEPGG
jgi:hypothetical protein